MVLMMKTTVSSNRILRLHKTKTTKRSLRNYKVLVAIWLLSRHIDIFKHLFFDLEGHVVYTILGYISNS